MALGALSSLSGLGGLGSLGGLRAGGGPESSGALGLLSGVLTVLGLLSSLNPENLIMNLVNGLNLFRLVTSLIGPDGILSFVISGYDGLFGIGLGQLLWIALCNVVSLIDLLIGYGKGVDNDESSSSETRYGLFQESINCKLVVSANSSGDGLLDGLGLDTILRIGPGIITGSAPGQASSVGGMDMDSGLGQLAALGQ